MRNDSSFRETRSRRRGVRRALEHQREVMLFRADVSELQRAAKTFRRRSDRF